MRSTNKSEYLDEEKYGYVVEYRGKFEEQISKVNYAYGKAITSTLGIIAVKPNDLEQLRKDVPAIIFIEGRSVYTLQDIELSSVGNIEQVKINSYLNLTGRGVLVGMIDSGINYLNKEFIREDGTSRIIEIWDQSEISEDDSTLYIGKIYSNEQINKALELKKNGGNPYDIVPTKDKVGHGTKMSGIIGARGYNKKVEGIANDCDFLVVKLFETNSYQKILRENNLSEVPVYNNSEILSAIEYLRKKASELKRPIVIYMGVGSTEGSHDGYNITARFITSIASKSGIVFVAGTGNLGSYEGHVTDYIGDVGGISDTELFIPVEINKFEFTIWVQKPNTMDLNIISPKGESTGFISANNDSIVNRKFYLLNTNLEVKVSNPESFTGHQIYTLKFSNIKPGIWRLSLRGGYVTNGRYDIWLKDPLLLPPNTKFLNSNNFNTLTIPSTARKVVTVAYYESGTGAILPQSGLGFNTNNLINPDISVEGTNILTVSEDGESTTSISGSSVATAIVAGVCVLLLQWGIVDKNDISINSSKIRSFLIYSATRTNQYSYPNESLGYGKLNFSGVFDFLSGKYKKEELYKEYYRGDIYVRIPKVGGSSNEGR